MTEQAHQNGPSEGSKFIDQIDPDDPEYIRQMRRPAEVKEDVQQMDQRKRVSAILQSQAFKEELEQIVMDQISSGPHPASLMALQQISELLLPHSKYSSAMAGPVIPIADIRGVDSLNYTKPEKLLRCKVAAAFRLVDLHGWAKGIHNIISVRINQDHEHFLVNPYGLMYNEISAASLIKVTLQGEILDSGITTYGINKASFSVLAAIHAARPDLKALILLRTAAAISVSVMKCGLLPISQESIVGGDPVYYEDFLGEAYEQDEKDKITRALGPRAKLLFIRNHGVIVGGESIEEAFHLASNVMSACESQVQLAPMGLENISLIPDELRQKREEALLQAAQDGSGESRKKWRRGEMEFEALMRHLDNAGYRTGYSYREPMVKRLDRRDRANSEVEIPPTTSSFNYMQDEDKFSSPLKHHLEKQKKAFKSEWLATPNVYKKEEIDETGTPYPKKITKWVAESDPKSGGNTPVKIDNANQFAPLGHDPKELRIKHKEIKKDYYTGNISAGPQSKILEGPTWEEAQKIKDGQTSGTTDGIVIVGAASKGIIKRDHQHNAVVYKQYYAPNPFDSMSEDEMAKYKEEVETKNRGGSGEPVDPMAPGPEGQLISSEERMRIVKGQEAEIEKEVYPSKQYLETSLDGPDSNTQTAKPTKEIQRSRSERYSDPRTDSLVKELEQNFTRSKSERYPKRGGSGVNGEGQVMSSPTKSTSSAEGTLDERSSREGSPVKELPSGNESPTKSGSEKKKKKFRMPSFSKGKKEKKAK